MRITFKTLNRHMQKVINDRYADLAHLQEQLSTGRRLLRPSDDPSDVANALKLRSKVKQLSQHGNNIEDGMGFMAVTDTALVSTNDLIQRMRELAIQASNDTLSVNERSYILKEVEQLTRQLLSIGNTQFKGDYIFGGTQTRIAPFPVDASRASDAEDYREYRMAYYDAGDPAGPPYQLRNSLTDEAITNIIPNTFSLDVGTTHYVEGTDYTVDYVNGTITPINPALQEDVSEGGAFETGPNGFYSTSGFQIAFEYVTRGRDIYGDTVESTGDVLREIESDIVVPINIPAEEFTFNADTGVNMIEAFIRFGQNLKHSDTTAIEGSIGEISDAFENILAAQTKNGARMNRFETTNSRNELQYNETTRLQSEIEDAEFAETVGKFSLLETVYNAALRSGARIIQPSLADFL